MRVVKADANGLEEAAPLLLSGGVAVIPTDTVYGLAAHPRFPKAVQRLYDIKRRDAKKPIALLAGDEQGARDFLGVFPNAAHRLASRYWPGALTLVLPSAAGGTEGVRVPNHAWTRELLTRCGGVLRVTSANLSGEVAATEAGELLTKAGFNPDLLVDGGISPGGVASMVLRVEDEALTLLRPGPIPILTLASASPRRAKILREHKVDFIVATSAVDEVSYEGDPVRTVRENALRKGEAVHAFGSVLSADTIVSFKGRIFGKPRDLDEAKEFLRVLGGETHQVLTAVAYRGEVRVETSNVTFKPLDEREISAYVADVRPLDRAGAYDIDESGSRLVASFTGSYENIMGLPLEPLRDWGILEGEDNDSQAQQH